MSVHLTGGQMKYGILIVNLLLSFFFGSTSKAQDNNISGNWKGKLDAMGTKLTIVFNIEKNSADYKGTMDSPDQGAYGIKVDDVIINSEKIIININSIGGVYDGTLIKPDSLTGLWKQNGYEFDLNLKKSEPENEHSQNPERPFPYSEEEVFFENEEGNAQLSGTLTYPKGEGKFPAAILISGSGLQDRDEALMGHKPFLVISDYLTRNGIAVLRYDDRGFGKSKGDASNATTEDFALDAIAGIDLLRGHSKIDPERIGIVGHSEGGIIAPMIASGDDEVAFIVMLAGPGIIGKDIIYQQSELLLQDEGIDEKFIKKYMSLLDNILTHIVTENDISKKSEMAKDAIHRFSVSLSTEENEIIKSNNLQMENKLQMLLMPWVDFYLKYDPADAISETVCPVLALLGEKDLQVPAKTNIVPIKRALTESGNVDFKVLEMKGLNHLFQECETGAIAEYGKIKQTISPKVLRLVSDWILEKVDGKQNE